MQKVSVMDRCGSGVFMGMTAFVLCNMNFDDVKWKRKC